MRGLLAAVLVLAAMVALPCVQQARADDVIRLACSGKKILSGYGETDATDTYVIDLAAGTVVSGQGRFAIVSNIERGVGFRAQAGNSTVGGWLDRLSGEINVHARSKPDSIDWLWKGWCTPARPMF
jgi:hypothetical protein